MDTRHEAIQDCKYIWNLSESATRDYINLWLNDDTEEMSEDDKEYCLTLKEIAHKLGTTECLLTKEN